jgi:hypothetical protein|tara:strand:+ start:784 stop:1131 length:348 start_codon:yes stop_codon:yes gene_type:complete
MDKDKRKKSVKDSWKSRITAINRGVLSPKAIADEIKKHAGGTGGKTISNKDFQKLLARLKKSGKTFSDLDAMNLPSFLKWISKKRPQKVSKPKSPHLKHGGKAKKMRTYKKGGKA